MKLWEGLEQDLNYNAMVSQRGVLNLYHSDAQRDAYARRGNAMRLHGVDAELLDRAQVRKHMYPLLDFDNARFPIQGGLMQRRGGTVRHDAVAWGYARAADQRGVDIIAELRGDRHPPARAGAWSASRPRAASSRAGKVGARRAPATPRASLRMAGLRLPIESHVLQAFVSEGIKPFIDGVVTFGAGHFYISQSDKGGLVFGGDIDGYNSYAQRGNLPGGRGRVRGRHGADAADRPGAAAAPWGGIMDMSMDGSPDHRQDADRWPLSQCRLVLRRLQGDARLGLVLRPHHRPRRAARAERAPIGSTASPPGTSSTKRARATSPTCTEGTAPCASTAPIAANAATRSSPTSAMPPCRARPPIRTSARRCRAKGVGRLRVPARQPRRHTSRAVAARCRLPGLARRDTRCPHARDPAGRSPRAMSRSPRTGRGHDELGRSPSSHSIPDPSPSRGGDLRAALAPPAG